MLPALVRKVTQQTSEAGCRARGAHRLQHGRSGDSGQPTSPPAKQRGGLPRAVQAQSGHPSSGGSARRMSAAAPAPPRPRIRRAILA